jgi:hypothetical protein
LSAIAAVVVVAAAARVVVGAAAVSFLSLPHAANTNITAKPAATKVAEALVVLITSTPNLLRG